MNTTRIDHTNCSHPVTPAGRKACRDARRVALRAAQRAHAEIHATDGEDQDAWDNYYALVQEFAWRAGLDLAGGFYAVENGPLA
jgi:hypothetical protein